MLRVNHVSCGRVAMPRSTTVRANATRPQRAHYMRGPSRRAPLSRSISAPPPRANFAPRMHHSTDPVRLSDEYTYFADRIEKRARWERIRNWVVFGGSAALGSAVAEATIVLSGMAPPDTIGAGLAFGGIALGSAGLQWALIKIRGVGSIPTSMGGRLANPADPKEKAFYDTVHELAKIANLPQPPAVYIIPTEEMNAFAAGTRPGSQVTAATTALLRECTHEEMRAVMAHEIGHLRNGDGKTSLQMIAMNAGFFAVLRLGLRMLQFSSDSRGRSDNDKKDIRKPLGIALTVLGLFFVAFGALFQAKTSRRREFDADASCVAFTRDNAALASALRKISRVKPSALASSPLHTEGNHQLYGHMYFSDVTSAKPKVGLMDRVKALLATHPPVEERIAKLNSYTAAALQMQKRADQPANKQIGPGVASRSVGGSTKGRERIN